MMVQLHQEILISVWIDISFAPGSQASVFSGHWDAVGDHHPNSCHALDRPRALDLLVRCETARPFPSIGKVASVEIIVVIVIGTFVNAQEEATLSQRGWRSRDLGEVSVSCGDFNYDHDYNGG